MYKLVPKEKKINESLAGIPKLDNGMMKKVDIFIPIDSKRTSGDSDTANKANDLTEEYVRKKLKNMCMRPRRMIMKFLDE